MIANFLAGSWRAAPPDPEISEEELKLITPSLLKSGASALGWWRIRDSGLRECAAGLELKTAYQLCSLHAALHRTEIEEVITLLNAAGVEPVLVKGWAIARLYPEEGLRPYGDLDLCFLPGDYQKAVAALRSAEASKYTVDIHEGFGKLDEASLDELMARSEIVSIGSVKFRVLCAEDQLRILCTHFLRHGAWRPLWLCDIAVAVETRVAGFDWARCFRDDPRQAHWVACAIGLAHQLLGARVDDTPASQTAQRLPRWLIPDVLKNWDQPFPERYPPLSYLALPPMTSYLRHPRGLVKALRTRWPDPIEATIRTRGPFNGMPRLPFQIGNAIVRIVRFVTRTQ